MAILKPTKRRMFFANLHRLDVKYLYNKLGWTRISKLVGRTLTFIEYKILPKQKDFI